MSISFPLKDYLIQSPVLRVLCAPCLPSAFTSLYICARSHLLLVFPLGVEASLDAFPGLLEGLPLGALCRVMGAHANDVGAGEDQHIGHYLWRRVRERELEVKDGASM